MQTILLVILAILLLATLGAVFLLYKKFQEAQTPKQNDQQTLLTLQNHLTQALQGHMQAIDQKISDTHRSMTETTKYIHNTFLEQQGKNTQFIQGISGQSSKMIAEITEKITGLEKTNQQIVGYAEQLQSLENILKNPKQRGILGEYYLETILKNVLPPGSFQMQYKFADGDIVDAAVFIKDKIIPVDSKFSLENYNRIVEEKNDAEKIKLEKVFVNDLKMRIVETSKYIRPNEGTLDFAFMFVPHEAIYYDLLINKIGAMNTEDTENFIQRAAGKYHVLIVSPTSFLAYLQTVLQGLKALQIEETAKDIIKRVGDLGTHISAYDEHMKKLGGSLTTTVNHYNTAYKELGKIDKDVVRITEGERMIEPLAIERPKVEESS